MCENGFSFEYSATFSQALKAANKPELTEEYAKCVLFDYSYKYFYRDGFGKDYRILNLADDRDEETRRLYLTACLLAYYQQVLLFEQQEKSFRPFLMFATTTAPRASSNWLPCAAPSTWTHRNRPSQ